MAHEYPGNIRELENLIEHAFILVAKGLLDTCHLPEEFMTRIPEIISQKDIKLTMKTVESQVILEALNRNQNNRAAAARDLGIHKSTLFRKMKALGIQ
jgi:transcriptional regulator with PAS, ATPase and Fis domain